MAGKKNEKALEAEVLYKEGYKLSEIATRLDVPSGSVRRWKSVYHWDGEQGECNSEEANARKAKANARRAKQEAQRKMIRSVEENEDLNEKQKTFCLLYAQSFNAAVSYQKAYGVGYQTACVNGSRALTNAKIRAEIQRLKEMKRASLMAGMEDLVEKQMRIAFADLSDYIEWGQEEVPVMGAYGPIQITDEVTGEKKTLKRTVNTVRFKESGEVDAALLEEVKIGRDGASVKLASRDRAVQWLTEYFKEKEGDADEVLHDWMEAVKGEEQ